LIVFDVFQSDNDGFGGQSVSKAKKDDGDLAVKDPILIIGGGLGGLTVLEGEPSFGAIGYCIQFGPNVFHVFDRIGVSDAVLQKADSPPAVLMIDVLTGNEVTRVPTGPSFRSRFKYPYIIIHRIDLRNVSLDACQRDPLITLVPDAMVTRFDDSVTVTTEDGRSFEGVRARARNCLMTATRDPTGSRVFAPSCRWAKSPQMFNATSSRYGAGPVFRIVHYPLRHGTLFNIVAVFRRSTHSERGDVSAYRAVANAILKMSRAVVPEG
jgi:salicylate hydroxylase